MDSLYGRAEAINLEHIRALVDSIINDWEPTDVEALEKQYVGAYNVEYEY